MGVKVYGLSEYCVAEPNRELEPTLLMGYATLKEEEIREAVGRLKKAWMG